jgi:hypothetical protein
MTLYPEQYGLPDDAEIKDIKAFKKKTNWGEIPAFFQLIASSIADAEGFMQYGFDNALKRIIDRRNWNYDLLGKPDNYKREHLEVTIEPLSKPKICLYHVFSRSGYELLAFPYVNNRIRDEYLSHQKDLEFKTWDPSQMKQVIKFPDFHKFIAFTLNNGDDADMALVIHAHNVVNKVISILMKEVNVHEVKGLSIDQAFKKQSIDPNASPDELIVQGQLKE